MRRLTLTAACLTAACLTGCATSHPAPASGSMGEMGAAPQALSLGAGDSLGRAVYVNDLILAAAALDKSTTFTNVDVGSSEPLMDPSAP